MFMSQEKRLLVNIIALMLLLLTGEFTGINYSKRTEGHLFILSVYVKLKLKKNRGRIITQCLSRYQTGKM